MNRIAAGGPEHERPGHAGDGACDRLGQQVAPTAAEMSAQPSNATAASECPKTTPSTTVAGNRAPAAHFIEPCVPSADIESVDGLA